MPNSYPVTCLQRIPICTCRVLQHVAPQNDLKKWPFVRKCLQAYAPFCSGGSLSELETYLHLSMPAHGYSRSMHMYHWLCVRFGIVSWKKNCSLTCSYGSALRIAGGSQSWSYNPIEAVIKKQVICVYTNCNTTLWQVEEVGPCLGKTR